MRQQQISVIISEPQTQICVSKETDKKIKKKHVKHVRDVLPGPHYSKTNV